MKIIFCGDRLGDEMRANLAVRRAKGEDVRGYLSYACQEAEPADEIEFLDDVPNGERSRINTLFGVRGVNRSEPNAGKGEAIQTPLANRLLILSSPPAKAPVAAGTSSAARKSSPGRLRRRKRLRRQLLSRSASEQTRQHRGPDAPEFGQQERRRHSPELA